MIRYGIVGAGDIVLREHLPVLARERDVRVVAIADPLPDRAERVRAIVGHDVAAYAHHAALLQRDDLDAVLVATPNDSHAAIGLDVLASGRHLFLEKPMATTPADALRLVRAAEESGLVVQVGYVFRYSHLFRRMAALVHEGAIGAPRLAWCHEQRRALPAEWRYSRARTGGVFPEKSCHHFDLFNWFLGAPAVRAAAFGGTARLGPGAPVHDILGNRFTAPPETDIPDHAVVSLDHGSARSTLQLAFFAPFRHRLEVGVHGEEGLLVAHEDARELVLHREGREPERAVVRHPEGIDEPVHHGSVQQHREFLAAVRGEAPVWCDARMGLEGLWPAFMAETALAEGRIVHRAELS